MSPTIRSEVLRPKPQVFESPCDECAIREVSVCASLNPEQLNQLRTIATSVRVDRGGVIYRESEPAEHVSNVIEGSVRLYKLLPDGRRQITGFLLPGDFLGVALNETYAFSAEALESVKLCRFSRRAIVALIERMPHLGHQLLEEAANEIVAAQDQMLLLGRKSAGEKVASFLIMMLRRRVARGEPKDRLRLPMSRADIADYLGLTTETVSRTFTRFKKDGIIALPSDGDVLIKRRAALDAIAQAEGPSAT